MSDGDPKLEDLNHDGVDADSLEAVLRRLRQDGATYEILAPHGGDLPGGVPVERPLQTMASVLCDAVLVAGGENSVATLRGNGGALRYVAEAVMRATPLAAMIGTSIAASSSCRRDPGGLNL